MWLFWFFVARLRPAPLLVALAFLFANPARADRACLDDEISFLEARLSLSLKNYRAQLQNNAAQLEFFADQNRSTPRDWYDLLNLADNLRRDTDNNFTTLTLTLLNQCSCLSAKQRAALVQSILVLPQLWGREFLYSPVQAIGPDLTGDARFHQTRDIRRTLFARFFPLARDANRYVQSQINAAGRLSADPAFDSAPPVSPPVQRTFSAFQQLRDTFRNITFPMPKHVAEATHGFNCLEFNPDKLRPQRLPTTLMLPASFRFMQTRFVLESGLMIQSVVFQPTTASVLLNDPNRRQQRLLSMKALTNDFILYEFSSSGGHSEPLEELPAPPSLANSQFLVGGYGICSIRFVAPMSSSANEPPALPWLPSYLAAHPPTIDSPQD